MKMLTWAVDFTSTCETMLAHSSTRGENCQTLTGHVLLHWMHFGGVGVYVTSLASLWSGRGLGEQQEAGVSRNGQSGAEPRGTVAVAGPTSD